MRFGLDVSIELEYAQPQILADLAVEAERAGWDGFFVQDYLFTERPIADPWISLAAIAACTQRIKLGAFMTALPRRRPWTVARQTVALDQLSNGRLIFGAALGMDPGDYSGFGEEFEVSARAEKLDEGLEVLAGLWSEKFSFQGRHYQVNGARFLPQPVQSPRIPIWVAGGWPNQKPFRRAARWDGVYVMTKKVNGELLLPADVREILDCVQSQRGSAAPFDVAAAGETPNDPQQSWPIVAPYADAGLTWWMEAIGGSLEAGRRRITSGPPRG